MKCLSLKQPHATLLATGIKTIETRKWNSGFRGEFLIHASKTVNKEACDLLQMDDTILIKGAIIGKCILYDVKKYTSHDDFESDRDKHFSTDLMKSTSSFKKFGFLIKDATLFRKSIPYSGKLGFFEVDSGILGIN